MDVALYARAWVEIFTVVGIYPTLDVALYARAWVEIVQKTQMQNYGFGRPLREGVGRNWTRLPLRTCRACRPLREGVGRNSLV